MIGYEAFKVMHENPNARFKFDGSPYRVNQGVLECELVDGKGWEPTPVRQLNESFMDGWERLPDARPRLTDANLLEIVRFWGASSIAGTEKPLFDTVIAELEERTKCT